MVTTVPCRHDHVTHSRPCHGEAFLFAPAGARPAVVEHKYTPEMAAFVPSVSEHWTTAGVLTSSTSRKPPSLLPTVQLTLVWGSAEHTGGLESRKTPTVGLVRAVTGCRWVYVLPQLATPGVTVEVPRLMGKSVKGVPVTVHWTWTAATLATTDRGRWAWQALEAASGE